VVTLIGVVSKKVASWSAHLAADAGLLEDVDRLAEHSLPSDTRSGR
jgi:hypothetical protein